MEAAPDVARETVQRPPVHPPDEPAPALNHNHWCATLERRVRGGRIDRGRSSIVALGGERRIRIRQSYARPRGIKPYERLATGCATARPSGIALVAFVGIVLVVESAGGS
jgi:hypothetical protein